jgi:hydroquinone 1,2-dioxygenase/2,6-dichloro-p-hydroquinone 1,2-dioxygenase/glyoxalase family protein
MSQRIQGLHHITLCTGTAQADVDFFVKVMGQRFVKRTLFYDGHEPIYHLYFADEVGTPGTVMTSFPMRWTGIKGRQGTGQFQTIAYSVPKGSIDAFWRQHLEDNQITVTGSDERFGQAYLSFLHPGCGIPFEVVEDSSDTRKPWKSPHVPEAHAVRGFHNWTASVGEMEDMDSFMRNAWSHERLGEDKGFTRYQVDGGGPAKYVDIVHEPDRRQGSWTLGEGIVHHGAFAVPDMDIQAAIKFDVEGMGFTDFSERKNRGYFESVYVRTPGGPMFEATHSLGFTNDETLEDLGKDFKLSPQFESQKGELVARMHAKDPIVV